MTHLGRGVTVKNTVSQAANPFAKITAEEMKRYAGQVIAVVDQKIVAHATSLDELRAEMQEKFRGTQYARLTLP